MIKFEYLILALAIIVLIILQIQNFLQKPTEQQLQDIKEWLLYAVIQAEAELGSGTGKLKLRYVYNMFLDTFEWAARYISFEQFSKLVDISLQQMKVLLESNSAIYKYVTRVSHDNITGRN